MTKQTAGPMSADTPWPTCEDCGDEISLVTAARNDGLCLRCYVIEADSYHDLLHAPIPERTRT